MAETDALMRFRLDPRSGLPAYQQLFDQVAAAVRLGVLRPGDQLPSVREVVGQVAINPNTVHRAYRELEGAGLAEGRPGIGTFVVEPPLRPGPPASRRHELFSELVSWITRGVEAGLGPDDLRELFTGAMAASQKEAIVQ